MTARMITAALLAGLAGCGGGDYQAGKEALALRMEMDALRNETAAAMDRMLSWNEASRRNFEQFKVDAEFLASPTWRQEITEPVRQELKRLLDMQDRRLDIISGTQQDLMKRVWSLEERLEGRPGAIPGSAQ